ncbi:hypothetical protein [Micromonospora echinospora]|uniref:hypothetical protein n=1 Tax=Micromonospora echinospora TaxID=1877 RepID=UPI003A862856
MAPDRGGSTGTHRNSYDPPGAAGPPGSWSAATGRRATCRTEATGAPEASARTTSTPSATRVSRTRNVEAPWAWS